MNHNTCADMARGRLRAMSVALEGMRDRPGDFPADAGTLDALARMTDAITIDMMLAEVGATMTRAGA